MRRAGPALLAALLGLPVEVRAGLVTAVDFELAERER